MVTERQVLDSMRHIVDPDLGKDIVSLGFIKNLRIEGGHVSFTVELTTPACPVKERFKTACEEAVKAIPGVESVAVEMSAMAPKAKSGAQGNPFESVGTVIAVSSCKGGVGKSTVAAHLARSMQREGLRVGLLDTDIYGPSLPTLFGIHRPQLYIRDNKLVPIDADGLSLMSLGFVLGESPAVLRGPIVSQYITQIMHQTAWGELDYVIIDMPPGTGDIQLTIAQQAALDGAVIVTTPHSLSLVDVAKGIMMFEKLHVPVLGIVENMSYFVCDQCEKKHHIFGSNTRSLRERFGLESLGELPIIHGLSDLESPEAGAELEAVRLMTENVHRQVGQRRVEAKPAPVVTPVAGALHVRWPDATESLLPNRDVRLACRCANCIDEHTGDKLLDPERVPEEVGVEAIQTLGNYAVSIAWSDGHSTGIYSWEHLKELAAVTA